MSAFAGYDKNTDDHFDYIERQEWHRLEADKEPLLKEKNDDDENEDGTTETA